MKLNKNSLVYKLLKMYDGFAYRDLYHHGQTTLCNVIVDFVFLSILGIILLIGTICIFVFLLAMLYTILLAPLLDVWLPGSANLLVTSIFIFSAMFVIILITGIFGCDVDIDDKYPKYLQRWLKIGDYEKDKVVNTSSLWYIVSTWLKDRKEKLCRIVTLED